MPPTTLLPQQLRSQVFLGSAAVREGLLTGSQLRSRAVRHVLHGVYADARLPDDHGARIAATALVLPSAVLIAGRSAAWLHGVRQVRADDRVEVFAAPEVRRHSRAGIAVHTGPPRGEDIETIAGFRVTNAAQTCIDVGRWHEEATAVCLIDAFLAAGVVTDRDLTRQLRAAPLRGNGRARRALAIADGRAESPPESLVRVRLVRAGVPPPVPQLQVWHCGRFVGRVDLGWPHARLALEYDGAWHADRLQLGRDRRRLNALVAAGWTVIHVTAADLRDLSVVIGQVREFLDGAAA